MASGDPTLVERWLAILKNYPLVAIVVIVCIAVAGLASFTKSVETISGQVSKVANMVWPPKIPSEVLANLRRAVSEVRLMNSAKGAMMGALDNYVPVAGSPGSWSALLVAMDETKTQLLSARKAVVAYNSLRPQLSADSLLKLIDERNALLLTYLVTPPPSPIDKEAAEKLRDKHKELIAKIATAFEPFAAELDKYR